MKSYPSIPKNIRTDVNIYAFPKYDGSQIRAEWSPKRGFYKFGTKNQMLGEDHPIFGCAIPLIKDKYELDLDSIFKNLKYQGAVCFFELYSANSFAGYHPPDDVRDIILFDVAPNKQGLMPPAQFVQLFESEKISIPAPLYQGKANSQFVEAIRSSKLENLPLEGVVCKGMKDKQLIMFKIKTRAWLDKLKNHCKDDQKLFEQLA